MKKYGILVKLFMLVSIVLCFNSVSKAAEGNSSDNEKNLLVNADGTQGMTGWVSAQKWYINPDTFCFCPQPQVSATMYQDVEIVNMSVGTEMQLTSTMYCYNQTPSDIGTIKLEFLNDDKSKVLLSNSVTHASPEVVNKTISLNIPEGAKYARVTLRGDRRCGTYLDTYFKNTKLTVSAPVIVEPQSSQLKVVLEPKEELQLSVDDDLYENTQMIWTSSDNSVATVDDNGVVKAIAPGNTIIQVVSKDGSYVDVIYVLVIDDAKDYRLAVDLKKGQSCRLTIDDMTDTVPVEWSSLNEGIAIVSNKGKVTAMGTGLTIVTAYDKEGNIVGQIYVRVRE